MRSALVVGLVCISPLAGCGGSAPRADPVQERRVISEVNAFCQREKALPPVYRRSQQQIRAVQARFAALMRAVRERAAYLPAGKDLNEAQAAGRALSAEARKPKQAGPAGSSKDFVKRFDRLLLRTFHDELALGLTCAGQLAQGAHDVERDLANSAH
jgi:hypothetical protein